MKITNLTLNNVGSFEKLDIRLAPRNYEEKGITVLIGNNGSGKTAILKSLATSLSWFVARIQTESGKGSPIPELVIKNDTSSAAIDIEVFHPFCGDPENGDLEAFYDNYFHWRIAKTRKSRKSHFKSELAELNVLIDHFKSKLEKYNAVSLPLIAFYSVERVVLDIPLKIRQKHSFEQLDAYDRSLTQGVDFRRFFEWFREREDAENESSAPDEWLAEIKKLLGDNELATSKLAELNKKDKQLDAVRAAIQNFMPEFSNLKIRRKPLLHMSVEKNGKPFNVLQLSQGEKSLLALIGDIARRLAIMNPDLKNPLEGKGIVLIDEVDLHLHPKWQRTLITQLHKTFPSCQFVLTTHSPLVISDTQDILTYLIDNGELTKLPNLYGQDVNAILSDFMETDIRNKEVEKTLDEIFSLIADKDFTQAKSLIKKLEDEFDLDIPELVKARLSIELSELDD